MGRALPGFHAFPGRRVGGLPADESWLHLSCRKMFSSSKYGSAGSKWNSELITNGLKSQSHLKNSHFRPCQKSRSPAMAPSQARGWGCLRAQRPQDRGSPAPQLTLCGTLDLPHPLLCLSFSSVKRETQQPLPTSALQFRHPKAVSAPFSAPLPLWPYLVVFSWVPHGDSAKGPGPTPRDSQSRPGRGQDLYVP